MSVIGSNILAGASGQAGYFLTKSLRFRSSASAYLNRTPASASNRRTFTYSGWLKRGLLDTTYNKYFFSAKPSISVRDGFYFGTNQTLSVFANDGSSALLVTSQVFRDVSAWYHIVVAVDTTQATASDRIKLYVNGVQVTAFGTATYPSQNYDWAFNNTVIHTISDDAANAPTGLYHYDGYMTEVNFIDGQALTPSSFGETSTSTGVWIPKKYTGTYGTNGFYLPFTDTTSTSTLGTDFSGNSNTWTVNNISLTAGSTYDSMNDVPTLTSATTANYAVFNPLAKGANVTISDGNLKYSSNTSSGTNGIVSMYITTGMKSYFEFTCGSAATYRNVDIGGMVYAGDTGLISGGTGGTGTFATWTTGDVVRFACDYNAGTIACYKNATLQTTVTGVTNTSPWQINAAQAVNLGEYTANFGQQPFAYTPPTGFVALNTFNLPTPTIGATASSQANEYFDVTTYTGNGTAGRVITMSNMTNVGFAWVKIRSGADDHRLANTVTGGNNHLKSNATDAESTSTNMIQAFSSNTFTIGSDTGVNVNSSTYVGWVWANDGTSGSSNTAGSITSTVSASTTAGFSIVTYTGNATNGATVGHGLGVSPSMIIGKIRSTTGGWYVWQTAMGDNFMQLNTTAAQLASTANGVYNTASFSSTVFALGSGSSMNASGGTFVAYCFAPIAGYSAFGSYTGNGSTDGAFIYTGFRPRFIMVKSSSAAGNGWIMYDTSRNTYNIVNYSLFANESSAENASSLSTENFYDLLSNGFKARTSNAVTNQSSATYIYMAFAENPFKYANAR